MSKMPNKKIVEASKVARGKANIARIAGVTVRTVERHIELGYIQRQGRYDSQPSPAVCLKMGYDWCFDNGVKGGYMAKVFCVSKQMIWKRKTQWKNKNATAEN